MAFIILSHIHRRTFIDVCIKTPVRSIYRYTYQIYHSAYYDANSFVDVFVKSHLDLYIDIQIRSIIVRLMTKFLQISVDNLLKDFRKMNVFRELAA